MTSFQQSHHVQRNVRNTQQMPRETLQQLYFCKIRTLIILERARPFSFFDFFTHIGLVYFVYAYGPTADANTGSTRGTETQIPSTRGKKGTKKKNQGLCTVTPPPPASGRGASSA